MGDQAALQEAIQRARQLAAKITQSAPVKRQPTGGSSDHVGPVKVTLAYEKPINNNSDNSNRQDRHRSSSRDYNRNERDQRDFKSSDHRDSNHTQRDSNSSNRSNYSSGYNSQSQNDLIPTQSSSHQPPPLLPPSSLDGPVQLGSRGSSEEKIELIIPHAVIGLVIGKGGENIKRIQNESGATVRVDPNTIDEKGNKLCTITGSKQAVDEAHAQVANVIENAAQNKRPRMQADPSSDSYRMKIPAHRTGAIIGKSGETIKSIKQDSGCEIELDKNAKDCAPGESIFIIRGSPDKIQKARSLIEQRLARGARDGPGGGGGGRGGRDHFGGGDRGGSGSGSDRGSGRSRGGFATGANAAPVAQYTDLPTPYTAPAGQQSADAMAAWAAYLAQYSAVYGQQPGAQPAAPTVPYAAPGQTSLLGAAGAGPGAPTAPTMLGQMAPHVVSATSAAQQPAQTMTTGAESVQQQAPSMPAASGSHSSSQDYTDQWIEFYLANGRPDYAEQMIQMKKQQQAQSAQSQQSS